jgi:outer membrane protein assembly factor BamB
MKCWDSSPIGSAWRVRRGRVWAAARAVCAIAVLGAPLGFVASAHAIPSWTTYHHDAARSGIDPESTSPLPPAKLWSTELDGGVWAEPLVYGPYVYVATENDTIYAIAAATGTVHWTAHLGTPVPSSELPCGSPNLQPMVGITSTPVIDPETNTIYAVTNSWEGTRASIHHKLVALDLDTGAMRENFPREVDPPYPAGGEAREQLQRAALALDGNELVIGFGSYADCETYWGWLVGASVSGTGPLKIYQVDSSVRQDGGSIWESGNGPAIDSSGNIYTATANSFTGAEYDHQDSVLKLSANLELLESWAPADWKELDETDGDLGSSGPLLLPGGKVFQVGKRGNEATLLYGNALGGVAGATASTFEACPGSGSWGGGIYVPATANAGTLYVNCGFPPYTAGENGVQAISVSELGSAHPTVSEPAGWHVNGGAVGPPIFAGGLVWVASWTTGTLYGLDPTSGNVSFEESLGGFGDFESPSAGGGRLFVANGRPTGIANVPGRTGAYPYIFTDNQLTAYGIAPTPEPTPTATALASSQNPAPVATSTSFNATVSPAPNGGTVAFTDNGVAVPGCEHVTLVVASHGNASCQTTEDPGGDDRIVASYSGDPYYAPSTSPALVQVVSSRGQVVSSLAPVMSLTSAPPVARLALSGAKESHTRWREGNALAHISAAADSQPAGAAAVKRRRIQHLPVGDTFSFTLNRAASVRLAFTQSVSGRRVGDRCVALARKRGKARRSVAIDSVASCSRVVVAGTLAFTGHAGLNSVYFEGRISRQKKLLAGRYTLVITASAAGQSSAPQRLQFTIAGSQVRRGVAAMLAGLPRHSPSNSLMAAWPGARTGAPGLGSAWILAAAEAPGD